ncbi:hypothetical protein QAD02_001157, partial [Eretmocerus hayati]
MQLEPVARLSSYPSKFSGETKINLTVYEYTWIIRDCAKVLRTTRKKAIASPTYVTSCEDFDYHWCMCLHPLIDAGFGHVIEMKIHDHIPPNVQDEIHVLIDLFDKNGKFVDLDLNGRRTFKKPPLVKIAKEDLEKCLEGENLTIVIKICRENIDDIQGPIQIDDETENLNSVLREFRLSESSDFENILETGRFSDFTLNVKNEKFHVHKNILSAKSPVFSAMFEHGMRENNENGIDIPDIEPVVMKDLLTFIYTGKIESIDKLNANLFLAANKYDITKLKDACEIALIHNLNMDNLADVLGVVDLFVPNKLLNKVIEFMKMNSEILKSEYNLKKLHKNGAAKYAKYGPLVREEIVPGEPIVWVFRPEDIAEVFKADLGRWPERRSHKALLKYRLDRRNLYNTGGLIPTNGPDWWRIRKEFQKDLSKPQNVVNYVSDTDEMARRFVEICKTRVMADTLPYLSRIFFQLTCLVAFDFKIDCFSEEELRPGSMSSKLIDAALDTNDVLLSLDNGPRLWRFFDTPKYRKLCRAQLCMEQFSHQMISKKIERMESSDLHEKNSLLEIYLSNPALDFKDVIGMGCDMLLAGIDTTSYTSAFALHHLAKNPETQEKLHREAVKLVSQDGEVTAEILKEAVYTKAVIKETLRLNPVAVGIGRILQVDVALNGYRVPKGTNVVTQNQVSCRLPEYFDNPNSFIPERWLRENSKNEKSAIHPYLVLPFGHGPRSCIARRLAEQHMQILLLRMCRHLRFTWIVRPWVIVSFIISDQEYLQFF